MSAATVLIVDDEPVACKMATSIFNAEGYETIIAGNGDEMHEILSSRQVDLILLDINLPGKNGLILAREIREKGDIALMFVTGRDNDIDRIQSQRTDHQSQKPHQQNKIQKGTCTTVCSYRFRKI